MFRLFRQQFRCIKFKKNYSNDVESDSMPVNRAFWIEIIYRGILIRNCPPLVRLQNSFNLKYESSIKESQFIFGDWYSLVLSWALGLNEQTICRTGWYIYICYLLAGRSVWWKTLTEGLKMRPKVAGGRGQHFQARGHSFSLYGPTLSRQITFFPAIKLGYKCRVCLRNFVIESAYAPFGQKI